MLNNRIVAWAKGSALAMMSLASYGAAHAQLVRFEPLATGASDKLGISIAKTLPLSNHQPACIKTLPAGLQAPAFGEIDVQGRSFGVILDHLQNGDTKLYLDASGSGDLARSECQDWTKSTYASKDGSKQFHSYEGSAKLDIHLAGKDVPASIGLYRADPSDPNSPPEAATSMSYYADFACQANVQVDGKSYTVLMYNDGPLATFVPHKVVDNSGSGVFLQIHGPGYDQFKGTFFEDVTTHLILGNGHYRIADLAPDGASFRLVKLPPVKIIPPPAVGLRAPSFRAATLDGRQVSFPNDYKGKIVLLDFWATWCHPCMADMPGVVAVYSKYHGRGLEILGVSLDQKDLAAKVAATTKANGMTWPQIYDGGYWNAAVAKRFHINSIPYPVLVDGDTGEILGEGDAIREGAMDKAVQDALARKKPAGS